LPNIDRFSDVVGYFIIMRRLLTNFPQNAPVKKF